MTGIEIKGYNDLTEKDIFVINKLKLLEEDVLIALKGLITHADPRWLSIARTEIEKGFMYAIRSIAKPRTVEFEL